MFLTLIGQKLGCSQRQTRGDDTLNTEGQRDGGREEGRGRGRESRQRKEGVDDIDGDYSSAHSRGIIGEVEEETHILHGAIFLKVLLEEPSCLHVNLVGRKTSMCGGQGVQTGG